MNEKTIDLNLQEIIKFTKLLFITFFRINLIKKIIVAFFSYVISNSLNKSILMKRK